MRKEKDNTYFVALGVGYVSAGGHLRKRLHVRVFSKFGRRNMNEE